MIEIKNSSKIALGIVAAGGIGALALNYFHHGYERVVQVEPGDVVLDVGAGTGLFTNWVKSRASLIVAVEPHPEHATALSGPNVIVVQKGAWNQKGEMTLHLANYETSLLDVPGMPTVAVETDTLDSIVAGLNKIDFIKMDIEGAEIEALQGAENVLRMARKVVVAAYHVRDGQPTYPWVMEFLRNRGFNVKLTRADWRYGLVHAWR